MSKLDEFGEKLFKNLEMVVIGKHSALELVVIGLL